MLGQKKDPQRQVENMQSTIMDLRNTAHYDLAIATIFQVITVLQVSCNKRCLMNGS